MLSSPVSNPTTPALLLHATARAEARLGSYPHPLFKLLPSFTPIFLNPATPSPSHITFRTDPIPPFTCPGWSGTACIGKSNPPNDSTRGYKLQSSLPSTPTSSHIPPLNDGHHERSSSLRLKRRGEGGHQTTHDESWPNPERCSSVTRRHVSHQQIGLDFARPRGTRNGSPIKHHPWQYREGDWDAVAP